MAIRAIDPDKPVFYVETESLGRLGVLPLTVGRMDFLKNVNDTTVSLDFMNVLIAAIGRKEDGSAVSAAEASGLSDPERDEVAAKFLDNNQYLYREQVSERHESEDGNVVVSYTQGKEKHPRQDGESNSDYLCRVFKAWQAEQRELTKQLIAPYKDMLDSHKRLFTPSFLEAFKSSQLNRPGIAGGSNS